MGEDKKKRSYKSLVRERQAGDTRVRIVEFTRELLPSDGIPQDLFN